MGGEKLCSSLMRALWSGSPPHGRGKAKRPPRLLLPAGITPAWAGKRPRSPARASFPQDHPRVGGEKELGDRFKTAELGSPPRRRGKEVRANVATLGRGITPAWAGKSLLTIPKLTTARDHPRAGGEKVCRWRPASRATGSPPHGRGKVPAVLQCRRFRGITPAWAGKRALGRA